MKQTDENQVKKPLYGKVLKGVGLLFLFLIITGLISNFSSPSRLSLSNSVYEGFDKVELDKGVYLGEVIGDLFSGEGQFQFLGGVIYSGEWYSSQMNGNGSCSYPGIGTYTGEYAEGIRSGEGTFTWENGDSYTGQWAEDYMTEGTYTFADGSSYVGTFTDGKAEDGIFTYAVPREKSEIQELKVTFEGGETNSVVCSLSNGFSYNGSLMDYGSAAIVYENGDTYSGSVSNGLREGEGIYTWIQERNQAAKYDGEWKDGQMAGKGTYYYTSEKYPALSGTFVNGLPDGSCIYTKEEGNTFTAVFQNGTCESVE